MNSCTDRVYDHLIQCLTGGTLKPGDLVQRRELAAGLQVSISPVNEAILQLELEGLLETIPRKGTRVRKPGADDIRGLLMSRIAIEAQAIRMVCGAPLAPHADRLRELGRRVDAAPARGAVLIQADVAFHRAIVSLAGCAALQWHFDRLMRQALILLQGWALPPSPRENHERLVASLLTDDPDRAEQAIRRHIQHGKAMLGLERGSEPEPERLRFGQSPHRPQERLGRSMEALLGPTPDGA